MRRPLIPLLVSLAVVTAACGGDDSEPEASSSSSSAAVATTTTAPPTPTTAGSLSEQYGVRYCELLAVTLDAENTTAEVWGTQGLNDCPDEAFAAIDAAAVAKDLGVTAVQKNGPRYWVLDAIVANELAGSRERRDFGGVEMRSIAIVELGPGIPNRNPYTERSVARDTEFVFAEGREVYELTAPDGRTYIMQSYSIDVDATLTAGDLPDLGARLALPEGWTFTTRVLDAELVVEDIDGTAVVIQDELHNSYQLLPSSV